MALPRATTSTSPYISDSRSQTDPLLPHNTELVSNAIGYNGGSALRSRTGCWRSASYIMGVEVAERVAYYGISSNLINYLTGPLEQSTVRAARNVNIWSGTSMLVTVLGAFIADSFLGRYRTIVICTLVYIMGLCLLTLAAMLPSICGLNGQINEHSSCFNLQKIVFFFSLYLVAVSQGGHKPCVQAFGADQFDEKDEKEKKARSSYFNWWYFTTSASVLATQPILNYVQDNFSWSLGFAIPCCTMIMALAVFLIGTRTYRFARPRNGRSPFVRLFQVVFAAFRNRRTTPAASAIDFEDCGNLPRKNFEQFRFLNKALIVRDDSKENDIACSVIEVEEAKSILRLIPIWMSCLVYAVVYAQYSTFLTKQAVTLDRKLLPGLYLPPASLQSISNLTIVLFAPVYDLIIAPFGRSFTGKPSGITMLQRIGTSMVLSLIAMITSVFVEKKRLQIAADHGLLDKPDITIPMSVWWLIPLYALNGIADFTMVGMQEFFYDQIPEKLRTLGPALYLSVYGVGSYLSSILVLVLELVTRGDGHESWFASNLNRGHLDYFYALLAGLSAMAFIAFLFVSKSYVYKCI